MPNVFEGTLSGDESRFAIVVSRYNESITTNLLQGAITTLTDARVQDSQIDVVWVPGAFEIPLIADQLAASKKYAAVLCLGCVIRGETTHDEHINRSVSTAIGQSAIRHQLPVIFGILTCQSLEQAIHRSGGNVGNKGIECAQAALQMVSLAKKLPI